MANVNMTGFVDAEPASRNDMFIIAPKKAAMPDERAGQQRQRDGDLAEHHEPREPGLRVVVDQELDEAAIPLERDRRAPAFGRRQRTLPIAQERVAAVGPRRRAELVQASLEPGEAHEDPDRAARASRRVCC